jgi:phage shock protein A
VSLWQRLVRIITARAHAALDAAEDPVESMGLAYRSQLAAFEEGRRGVADVLTSEKRLELEVRALDAGIGRATDAATVAAQAGDDAAARRALEREAFLTGQREQLLDEIADVQTQRRGLEELVERLGERVERLRTEKIALAARYATARAGVRAGASVTGLSNDTAEIAHLVERARERSRNIQARASALAELAGTSSSRSISDEVIARRLAALKGTSAS